MVGDHFSCLNLWWPLFSHSPLPVLLSLRVTHSYSWWSQNQAKYRPLDSVNQLCAFLQISFFLQVDFPHRINYLGFTGGRGLKCGIYAMYGKRTATLKCLYFPFREQYFYFCLQAHGSSLPRSVHYFCVGPADSDMCANSDTSVFLLSDFSSS